jgi:hypothetical protein
MAVILSFLRSKRVFDSVPFFRIAGGPSLLSLEISIGKLKGGEIGTYMTGPTT